MSDIELKDKDFAQLLSKAKSLVNRVRINKHIKYGGVACALLSKNREIYTGINIDANCGIGCCAEYSAIANMLKDNETQILKMITVTTEKIYPPCGRCRELIRMINDNNVDTQVMINNDEVVKVKKLLPYMW